MFPVDDAGKEQLAFDMEKARLLGTIRVRVYRATYQESRNWPVTQKPDWRLAEAAEVSIAEKALKVRRLHQVSGTMRESS